MINKNLYNTVALGGTFDHLHDGHKDFLKFAAEISKFIIIGVTDQQMTLRKKDSELIQPTHVRKQAVSNFCNQNDIKADIITIYDEFGPTLEKSRIQAIVCTNDTLAGANKINEVRDRLYLRNLPIHIHNLKKDKSGFGTISSQRIRAGEIDRKGNVYSSILYEDLELSEENRKFFSKKHGEIIDQPKDKNQNLRIVVGDSTLETFIQNKWQYDLGVFDGKRQRKEVQSDILEAINNPKIVSNRPGFIESSAVELLKAWRINRNFKNIFVEGEEDLTAVVAVLLMPLGTIIYYGQPNEGIVECVVNEDIKEEFFRALSNN